MLLGLVGDGVNDLVDLGVEIWLLETPFTVERKTDLNNTKCLNKTTFKVNDTMQGTLGNLLLLADSHIYV